MKLQRETEFLLFPKKPFNFELTVRKPAGWDLFAPSETYKNGTIWTAGRINGKLVGLKMLWDEVEKKIVVMAYTNGKMKGGEKDRLKETVGRLLGVNDDLRGFYSMAKRDPILKHCVKDLYGMRDTQSPEIFSSVVLGICLQMARLERSERMMDAITARHGTSVEFDHKKMRIQPRAETIAKLDPKKFSKECKLGYRGKYIVGSAKIIASGFPDVFQLMEMRREEAREKLMELPGVGEYSADIVNPNGGFPIDAWSVDVFGRLFFGKEPEVARDAIQEVKTEGIKRWGEYSWLAFFYVAQDLENLSRKLGLKLRLV